MERINDRKLKLKVKATELYLKILDKEPTIEYTSKLFTKAIKAKKYKYALMILWIKLWKVTLIPASKCYLKFIIKHF